MKLSTAAVLATLSLAASACSSAPSGPGSSTTTGTGTGGAGGGASSELSTIVSADPASVFEAEPTVAVSPTGAVAVAWIATTKTTSTIGYAISLDGGSTWSAPGLVDVPAGRFAFDPSLVADSSGAFYLSWADTAQGTNGRVVVARAAAGATSFGPGVAVSATDATAFYDRPALGILPSGKVIVSYAWEPSDPTTSPYRLFASTSPDGTTWAETTAYLAGAFADFARPCIPAGGDRVYLSYLGPTGVGLLWSDDEGATWPGHVDGISGNDSVGTQPCCVAQGDDVWLSYGNTTEVFTEKEGVTLSSATVRHSADRGATFGKGVAYTDPNAPRMIIPELAAGADGTLTLFFYNGKAKDDPAGTLRYTSSTDKGATWGASELAYQPILFTVDRGKHTWLGDYLGVARSEGSVYAAFADNASGTSHIRFYRSAGAKK